MPVLSSFVRCRSPRLRCVVCSSWKQSDQGLVLASSRIAVLQDDDSAESQYQEIGSFPIGFGKIRYAG